MHFRSWDIDSETLPLEGYATTLLRGGVLSTQYGGEAAYSHSIVAGGFEDTSYATRLIPGTSLITLDEIAASTS